MPTLKQAHLQFAQANRTKPKLQKSLLCQRTTTQQKWTDKQHTEKKGEQLTYSMSKNKKIFKYFQLAN